MVYFDGALKRSCFIYNFNKRWALVKRRQIYSVYREAGDPVHTCSFHESFTGLGKGTQSFCPVMGNLKQSWLPWFVPRCAIMVPSSSTLGLRTLDLIIHPSSNKGWAQEIWVLGLSFLLCWVSVCLSVVTMPPCSRGRCKACYFADRKLPHEELRTNLGFLLLCFILRSLWHFWGFLALRFSLLWCQPYTWDIELEWESPDTQAAGYHG